MLKAYKRISLTSPSWLVKWIGQLEYKKYFSNSEPMKLLDIGCGSGEKREVISKEIQYTGVDHPGTLHNKTNIDVYCSAYEMPFPDNSYDYILCTGVLEHLEEPETAVREAYRLLKLDGKALYTVPLFWHLHEEPRDFYRYTKYGIKYLFEKVGFEIIELKPLSGFWVTFGSEWNYYLKSWCPGFFCYLVKPIIAVNNVVFFILDKIDRRLHPSSEKWTWMYLVVVKKK